MSYKKFYSANTYRVQDGGNDTSGKYSGACKAISVQVLKDNYLPCTSVVKKWYCHYYTICNEDRVEPFSNKLKVPTKRECLDVKMIL